MQYFIEFACINILYFEIQSHLVLTMRFNNVLMKIGERIQKDEASFFDLRHPTTVDGLKLKKRTPIK